jgi:NitT/TauT family transport system substrate-binding protein
MKPGRKTALPTVVSGSRHRAPSDTPSGDISCALRPVRSLLSAAAAVALAPLAGAQAAEPITIMVGGINKIIYLPAKLAEALGYFKDEGLTVELQSQPAGVDAENQLIAGAVQAVVGFYDHTIDLQSKGKELEAIAVFCKVPGEVELVSTKAAPSFKTMADAKGKTLGVTGLGSSTDFLTRYLADRQGVASKDYTCCRWARATPSSPPSSRTASRPA